MALTAALDASVLYPLPLRDTLLRAAQVGLYDPCWSERILDEVARNLVANRVATAAQAAAMLEAMCGAFDAATVADKEIARLEPAMTNDLKDRHVLAASAFGNADVLVTSTSETSHGPRASRSRLSRSIPTASCLTSTDSTRMMRSVQRLPCRPQRSPARR